MENPGLRNFIRVSNELINLAYVTRFVVESDGAEVKKISIQLFGDQDAIAPVEGNDAASLMELLSEPWKRGQVVDNYGGHGIEAAGNRLSEVNFDVETDGEENVSGISDVTVEGN